MTIFAVLAVFLGLAMPLSAMADQARFFSQMNDVPLMPGLSELEDQAAVFDKPEGRVVQSVAQIEGGAGQADILAFYSETLPQLGWERIDAQTYGREDEILELSFEGVGAAQTGDQILRILVKPVSVQ